MANASDDAAIVWHLEQTLAALMPDADQYTESEVAAEIDRVMKKAELARLLGVFDDLERDAWVERAARVTDGRPPAAELRPYRARVLAHLERLRDRARNSSPGPNTPEQQATLDGALLAYERAGLLTDSQARVWSGRLSIRKPHGLWMTEREKRVNREFRGNGSPRVFAGPDRRIGGTRIITVSVYDDGVVLAWQWDPTTAPRQRPDTILNRFYGWPSSHVGRCPAAQRPRPDLSAQGRRRAVNRLRTSYREIRPDHVRRADQRRCPPPHPDNRPREAQHSDPTVTADEDPREATRHAPRTQTGLGQIQDDNPTSAEEVTMPPTRLELEPPSTLG